MIWVGYLLMLEPLYHWRAQCSPQQLALFETALALVCSHAMSQKTRGTMIELRLDNNRLSAMKTNKRKLTACRHMLESLQSPVPQALTYPFEKLS